MNIRALALRKQPVIIKSWSEEFDFRKEILRSILVWIKLPNISLACWSADSLSRIGSVVGIPLYADECTAKQSRVSYSRLLIQMDVIKETL